MKPRWNTPTSMEGSNATVAKRTWPNEVWLKMPHAGFEALQIIFDRQRVVITPAEHHLRAAARNLEVNAAGNSTVIVQFAQTGAQLLLVLFIWSEVEVVDRECGAGRNRSRSCWRGKQI